MTLMVRIHDLNGNLLAEFPRPQADFMIFSQSDPTALNSLKFDFSNTTCHGMRLTLENCAANNLVFEAPGASLGSARFDLTGTATVDYSRLEFAGVDMSKFGFIVGTSDPVTPIIPVQE